MSVAEYAEWYALYQIEPWDELRSDMRNAMLMSLLANVNRDSKKHKKPFSIADFLPDWWGDKRKPQAVMQKFRTAVQGLITDGSTRDADNQTDA